MNRVPPKAFANWMIRLFGSSHPVIIIAIITTIRFKFLLRLENWMILGDHVPALNSGRQTRLGRWGSASPSDPQVRGWGRKRWGGSDE